MFNTSNSLLRQEAILSVVSAANFFETFRTYVKKTFLRIGFTPVVNGCFTGTHISKRQNKHIQEKEDNGLVVETLVAGGENVFLG